MSESIMFKRSLWNTTDSLECACEHRGSVITGFVCELGRGFMSPNSWRAAVLPRGPRMILPGFESPSREIVLERISTGVFLFPFPICVTDPSPFAVPSVRDTWWRSSFPSLVFSFLFFHTIYYRPNHPGKGILALFCLRFLASYLLGLFVKFPR